MKTLAILLLASNVFASCPDGWVEWPEHSGHCASLAAPKEADVPEVKPSKEKPPSDKMPSWEREGIHVDEAKPCAPNDAKLDQERAQADADGKKAAAIQ